MALDSYAALQAFVTAHLELDGTTAAQLPTFIQLAEAELARMILAPQREQVAYTVTAATEQALALPGDFRAMRGVLIDDDYSLQQVALEVVFDHYSEEGGKPVVYAIQNQGLTFGPTPDDAYTITITYLADLVALSDSSPSNWLLESHPDAYLYATLLQAEAFLANDQRLGLIQGKLASVIAQINSQGTRYRNAGPLRARPTAVA